MFLSDSLNDALDLSVRFPLLINFCSWAALLHVESSTELEVATHIWLSISLVGRGGEIRQILLTFQTNI